MARDEGKGEDGRYEIEKQNERLEYLEKQTEAWNTCFVLVHLRNYTSYGSLLLVLAG